MKLSILDLSMPKIYNYIYMKSEKQRLHLERLAEMKRGKPSPIKGRTMPPRTEEHKKFRSDFFKEYWLTHPHPKKGVKLSIRTRAKMSVAKGGNGETTQRGINNLEYKTWRYAVYERDNYTCQICEKRGGNLEAHHLKQWAKYPELRYDPSNGITVCPRCHSIIDKYRHYDAS